jgi:hypothetical protein
MFRSGIDQEALVNLFSEASAKQGEALRKAVSEATLRALQGRELTLQNIRAVVKTVTQAASAGAARNAGPVIDIEDMLQKAFAGMDAALLQAVEANRRALQQFVDRGVGLDRGRLRSAVADLEKMEDIFITTVSKAAQTGNDQLQAPWSHVIEAMKLKGTDTGAQAAAAIEQLVAQGQAALRDSREIGVRSAQALMQSYSTLVSGVLIGMSEGLQQRSAPPAENRSRKK